MIAELRISLLGEIRLEKNGEALRGLPSRAAQALLIYLACTPRAVPREKLAEMLWAERSSRQALTNLRTILAPLRREAGDFLLITRQTLAFNRESAYWLDAEAFEARLRDFLGQSAPLNAGRAAELEEILALYRGDFLDGFYLRDGRGFDEWTSVQRERLRLLAYEGFRALATWQLEAGQYRRGVETASRWMRLSPYDEHACRTLMWLLTRSGQRNLALRHYQQMQQTLAADLGVVPAPASQDLYAYLRSVEFPPPNNLPPPASSFIGRAGEVASLVETLRATFPRLVTLSGAGGLGKPVWPSRQPAAWRGAGRDAFWMEFSSFLWKVHLPPLRQPLAWPKPPPCVWRGQNPSGMGWSTPCGNARCCSFWITSSACLPPGAEARGWRLLS